MEQAMKLSPWFGENIRPINKGVYETNYKGFNGNSFALWNGYHWMSDSFNVTSAMNSSVKSYIQNRCWRGIVK